MTTSELKQDNFDVIRNINGRFFQVKDILIAYQAVEIYGDAVALHNKQLAEFPYTSGITQTAARRKAQAFLDGMDYSLAA